MIFFLLGPPPPPPPPPTHPEVVSDARPAYRIRPGGAQGQDQLSGYSPSLPSRTSFKWIVSPDEYCLLSSNFLYLRWWFLRFFEELLMEKLKSKCLLALQCNYFLLLKFLSVTLFRDSTAVIWPWYCAAYRMPHVVLKIVRKPAMIQKRPIGSKKLKTKIYQWQRRKARQKFWCGFRNNIYNYEVFPKKQAETFHLFFSVKRQSKNWNKPFAHEMKIR